MVGEGEELQIFDDEQVSPYLEGLDQEERRGGAREASTEEGEGEGEGEDRGSDQPPPAPPAEVRVGLDEHLVIILLTIVYGARIPFSKLHN